MTKPFEPKPPLLHREGMDSNAHGGELASPHENPLLRTLENLALQIPTSKEPVSPNPGKRAAEIVRTSGLMAGALSATLAIPPGPMGMLTVIPDLLKVWQIQQQMVADIAACYGKTYLLNRQMMVYCLFRHGAAMLLRDVVARVGERVIVKGASLRMIQQTLRKIGVHVTQKAVGKSLSRWLPIVGPVLIGGYSMMDTRKVGKTAIDTFSREIEIEDGPDVIDVTATLL